jgi:mRNA capping enzyme, C-terminal domain
MAYLYVGSLDQPFAVTKLTKNMKELHGKIIECKFDATVKQWVFMRERTDKSYPNAYTTAKCELIIIIVIIRSEYILTLFIYPPFSCLQFDSISCRQRKSFEIH